MGTLERDWATAGRVREPRVGKRRIRCSTVFLDAGGVIVLPRRDLVRSALEKAGITCDENDVPHAHYRAVRQLDRSDAYGGRVDYMAALCRELGVPGERMQDALGSLAEVADRRHSGEILWSEPGPQALEVIGALGRAGIAVVVVTNSNGRAAQNLSDAGICQTSSGRGAVVTGIIDSAVVGAAKPDPTIFHAALAHAGVVPTAAVHVGDMVSADVIGAQSAGIVPIHLDPERRCRASDHRHIRRLSGIWRHVAPATS
jgi:putative hydrolase of the HAD superfamily